MERPPSPRAGSMDAAGRSDASEFVPDHPLLDQIFGFAPALREATITAMYQIGSRVYFTNKQGSDWDFIAVARDYHGPEMMVGGDEQFSFEITLFDERKFVRLVEHHTLFVLAAVFVPAQFIWRRTCDYSKYLVVEYPRLRMAAKFEADFSIKKAARKWKKGDLYKGKKNFIAGLRFVRWSLQLVERDRIYDFQCANEQWSTISQMQSTRLDDYMNIYKPMILEEMNRLRDATRPAPLPPGVPSLDPPSLFVCEFARRRDVAALSRYYWFETANRSSTQSHLASSIRAHAVPHPSDSQLRLLRPDRIYGWFRRVPLRETAAGVIVRVPELQVVAYGPGFDLPELGGKVETASAAEDPRALHSDPDPMSICQRVYLCPWGRVVNLFWHAGEWLIFTDQSPTARDPLHDHAMDLHLARIAGGATHLSSAFWHAWRLQFCKYPDWEEAKLCTWQLLLTYTTAEIVLVGVRDVRSLQEDLPADLWANRCNWRTLKRIPTFEGLTLQAGTAQLASLSLDPFSYTGIVTLDDRFERIKIATLQHQSLFNTLLYCDSNWKREEMPWKEGRSRSRDAHHTADAILHIIQNDLENDQREKHFSAVFPDLADQYKILKQNLEAFCASVQQVYDANKHLQKAEFMSLVSEMANAHRPLLTRLYNREQEHQPTTARRLLVTPQLNTSISKTLAAGFKKKH